MFMGKLVLSVAIRNLLYLLPSIAMLLVGFATPIVLTWLGYLPFLSELLRKLKPYLVWPSVVGTYQVRPLPFFLGNAPTVGQAQYAAPRQPIQSQGDCEGYAGSASRTVKRPPQHGEEITDRLPR